MLNFVRLRYADMPIFLDATQVISGYQLQQNVTGGVEIFPHAATSTFLSGSTSAQLQQSPTFTFQPIAGDRFAQSFLRPLSPIDLLSFAQGGLPVDVLFRLAVQSVGSLENTTVFQQTGGEGSPNFFLLLHDLRRLQMANLIGIKLERQSKLGSEGKAATPERVFVTITATKEPALAAVETEARRLLGIAPRVPEVEVIYSRSASNKEQIALLTRSTLGVLLSIAFQIEVPTHDVLLGRTLPTLGFTAMERRPVMVIHSGHVKPDNPFTAIQFDNQWFWLDKSDFDSKLAFTMVNILLGLTRTASPSRNGDYDSGRLSGLLVTRRSFKANAVRLQLHALAYNLANFLRTLALPEAVKVVVNYHAARQVGEDRRQDRPPTAAP